jgi:hypothetical protein
MTEASTTRSRFDTAHAQGPSTWIRVSPRMNASAPISPRIHAARIVCRPPGRAGRPTSGLSCFIESKVVADIARCAGVPDHPLGALEHRAVIIRFVVSVDLACGIGRSNVAG